MIDRQAHFEVDWQLPDDEGAFDNTQIGTGSLRFPRPSRLLRTAGRDSSVEGTGPAEATRLRAAGTGPDTAQRVDARS